MVASSCTRTGSLSSDRCKIWPSVRETCSNVISGFFFPKPCCLRGQDVHPDSRTKPMTYQALIGSHFKRAEPTFLLGPLEPLFHVPSSESHAKHFLDRRVFRSVADEVLDLSCLGIPGHDQPILSIRRTRSVAGVLRHQVYSGRCWCKSNAAPPRSYRLSRTRRTIVAGCPAFCRPAWRERRHRSRRSRFRCRIRS